MTAQQQINPFWQFVDPLTVRQAAALVAGIDPDAVAPDNSDNYRPVLAALTQAVIAGTLPAVIRHSAWERGWIEDPEKGEKIARRVTIHNGGWDDLDANIARPAADVVRRRDVVYRATPDWSMTTVTRADLVAWLKSRGRTSGFFFPDDAPTGAGYLDPQHPRYAPKLAAAIRAWESVTDMNGRSPKQALEAWLRDHAVELGLADSRGEMAKQTADVIAQVANWQTGGGAPKTPEE